MAGGPAASGAPLRLSYHARSPPLAALAVAELAQLPLDAQADPKLAADAQLVLHLPDRQRLDGRAAIVRFLARSAPASQLAGADTLASVEVDHWIDFAAALVPGSGLEAACAALDGCLSLRTHLAGNRLSAADVACWAQLASTVQWDVLRRSGRLPHATRWWEHVAAIPQLRALAERHGPRRRAAQPKADGREAAKRAPGASDASFDIGLGPEWRGRVVTRFPPEPSGFLHIGHAKALILNQQIAADNGGKMLMRFDDTNPDKEKDVFVDSIVADARRLGADPSRVTYTSDYFDQMLDLAERLIRAGHLYADDTPQERMKEERLAKRPSARRGRSVEETLAVWREMVAGSKEGFRNCLRFRIDPASNNGTLRDPVAYRCNATPHLHTGTRYKVYPTYDCACPFVDALEGVTHALRTSEYKDREEQFARILKMQQEVWPGLGDVAVWDYSRLSFVHTVLSKRKLTRLVAMGAVDGWDDPRMPTVQGLLRRGLTVPALREFILGQGASKNVTLQEWDKIWAINKRLLDPVVPRHTAVVTAARVPLALRDVAATEAVTLPRHPKHPPAGSKTTLRGPLVWLDQADAALLGEGEEVTLMEWGNAIIKSVTRDATGAVTRLEGVTHAAGDPSATRLKLTWLADSPDSVPLSLVEFGHLITKRKLEEDDEIEDLVAPVSRWETAALGDANMRALKKGDSLQLMRKGYWTVDAVPSQPGQPLVLLSIPDGKAKAAKPPPTAAAAAAAAAPAAAAAAASASQQASAAGKPPSQSSPPIPVPSRSPEGAKPVGSSVPPTPANTPASTPQPSGKLPDLRRHALGAAGPSR